jgi:hypothetical protein
VYDVCVEQNTLSTLDELADFLAAPKAEVSASGLVSKPITVRLAGAQVLKLNAMAEKTGRPQASMLRLVAELAIDELYQRLSVRGLEMPLNLPIVDGKIVGDFELEKDVPL